MSPGLPSPFEVTISTRPLAGQDVSGDLHVVKPFENGLLIAVIDGLGHGPVAADAAQEAAAVLHADAHEVSVSLIQRCHDRLRGTRGIAISLASFNLSEGSMTWIGVGNVVGILLRRDKSMRPAHVSLVNRGGVVGLQLPPLHPQTVPVSAGDTLVFATDGIRSDFSDGLTSGDPPQQMAEAILARHAKGTDDALVLVARYRGVPSERYF